MQVPEHKEVRFVHPQFVEMLFLDAEVLRRTEAGERLMSFKDLEEVVRRQDLRVRCLKHWWEHNEVLLIMLGEADKKRWGLLALRKTAKTMRFYEAFCSSSSSSSSSSSP